MSEDGYTSRGQPDVGWWMRQITSGIAFRKKYAQEEKWKNWRAYYRGQWNPSVLPVNVYFKMMRTLVPRIYYRNPSVSIVAGKPGLENMLLAKLLERIDNKLLASMGVKQSMKRIVQQAVMFGTSFGKLGYGAEFTLSPADLGTEAPDVGTIRLQKRVEYNDLVQANRPWFMASHPGSTVVPSGSGPGLSAVRWIANYVRRPLSDLQDDPRFRNTTTLGASHSSFTTSLSTEAGRFGPVDNVDLIEVRDKKTGKVFVIAPHGQPDKRILYYEDDDLQVDGGIPYYELVFNEDDEVFWGVPDSQIIEPQQLELNQTRTIIQRHRRVSIQKWLAKRGSMTADDESKLISDEVKEVVLIDGDPRIDVQQLQPNGIPVGLTESLGLAEREIQEILGLGTNQFGEYAPGSADRSATEANIVAQATQIRIDERRDMVADLLVRVVNDMHHIIANHWSGEQVVDLVGPMGVPIWVKFRTDLLRAGRYEVKVDPDTSLPQTKQLREQKAFQLYGALAQNPLVDKMGLTEFLLSETQGYALDNLLLSPMMRTTQHQPMEIQEVLAELSKMSQQTQQTLLGPRGAALPIPTAGGGPGAPGATPNPNLVPSG